MNGTIPARKVFEDEQAIAFHDINPQAPVHVLIAPREHFSSLTHMGALAAHKDLLGHLVQVAIQIAATEKLTHGYRAVINTGPDGGQTVDHLHLHLLGGRAMGWPPG
ncbi:Histidine triad (HIT) nucleotide-binding protein, cyanobacterial subgroup [Acidisarcina polymorpha]|uniref:Histidine triad (HIT) nucleotide-binding protein, cyanobacterial subgroup n=1 Tax=Acidisarcina polymorpha TaxID=2211140 RepID=A0A2Z5G3F1_9BACT|nr:Histidine triad (HIT) nucleotide-binding protein, cyanobacterial subgroup [Acidisarcina polymorpha]